ncbi:MAG: citrate/2-methylcitrate synthase [Saccharofermentans sp.]|nr:citrate/2-methylcitrate synthase [Saccharofermentans sp.]
MPNTNKFSKVTDEINELASYCVENKVDPELYKKYDVKRGLRDLNGKGVLTGLTQISEIISSKNIDGEVVQCDGELYYRGIDVHDLVNGFSTDNRFDGFEEASYLLLFGKLPSESDLKSFKKILSDYRLTMPKNFVRDIIMKKPSDDIMNNLTRAILNLYAYDNNATDLSIPNVLRQSLELISLFPVLAVYSYNAKKYYNDNGSLVIHRPQPNYSTAQNILHMLRADSKFTELEARILDVALVLHAEHGGGNNSTFTTHVVTSSGTDTYAAMAAALSSLKGPKHGGANIKVVEMFADIKKHVKNWDDEDALTEYIDKILNKKAFDGAGVVYGMGHAVYSISDPRAQIFKEYVKQLSVEKHKEKEFKLYSDVERIAARLISEQRHIYKGVSANIDFYSGFVYTMLNLPTELYTPLFAIARISGWSAHRIEELTNASKIIRPAYRCVQERKEYRSMDER